MVDYGGYNSFPPTSPILLPASGGLQSRLLDANVGGQFTETNDTRVKQRCHF